MIFELDYFLIWSLLALLPVLIFPMFVGCGESTLRATAPANFTPFTVTAAIGGGISLVNILDWYEQNSLTTPEQIANIANIRDELRIGLVDPGVQQREFRNLQTITVTSLEGSLNSEAVSNDEELILVPQFQENVIVQDWTSELIVQFSTVPLVTNSGLPDRAQYRLNVTLNCELLDESTGIRIPFLTGSAVFIANRTDGVSYIADFSTLSPEDFTETANIIATNTELRELEV